MRVLLQVNGDRDEAGGVQTLVRGLADHLLDAGHAVTCSWAHGSAGDGIDGAHRIDRLHVRAPPGRAGRALHLPSLMNALRLLAQVRPHVVNIHYASANALYFVLLRPLFGYRLVITCHGSDLFEPLRHDREYLARLLRAADEVTGVSRALTEVMPGLVSETIRPRYLPNGVDTSFWSPTKRCGVGERREERPLLFAAVGRLEVVKGFDLLIEAFAKVIAQEPRARLVILGEGSQRVALEARIASHGIGAEVALPGARPQEAVRDLLRQADLFVLPSRSEGMPLSLLEAMACGLPCIASDVGGVARTGGDAIHLVPPEDVPELARSMAELAKDAGRRERIGADALGQARRHSSSAALARYERLLRGVVAGRHP